jgi:hypothetical protein
MINTVSLPPLPSLAVTGTTAWILFALVTVLWLTATLVLEYHWKNYAVGERQVASVRFLYRAGSFFLLAIIFLSVLSFSLS